MEVKGADLKDGLLSIELARPEPQRTVRRISITIPRLKRWRLTMTSNDTIKTMPQDAFAALGGGRIAYLRPLRSEDVHALFPQAPELQPGLSLWALLSAAGQPIMLTDSKAAAIASAHENDLETVSVH